MNKTPYLLVECTDYDVVYRVLLFNDDVDKRDIQNRIYEIKRNFYENNIDDWTVDDVLNELSLVFDFYDYSDYKIVEV